MGIRERLAQLEATRGKSKHDDRHLRPVYQLEGQSEDEAWRLSGYSGYPPEQCAIIPESALRHIYFEVDGDLVAFELRVAEIRAAQEARRAVD